MIKPDTPKQTARANNIFAAIGVVANMAGIATLFSDQLGLVAPVIAGIALASGAYLIVRRWRKPLDHVAVFAIIIMLAGAAILTVVVERHGGIIPAPPGSQPTPTPSGSPLVASRHLLHNGPVTFYAGTGLDVDTGKTTVLKGTTGQSAPADLSIDLDDYLRSPVGDMFLVSSSDTKTPDKCSQLIAAGQKPASIDLSSGYLAYNSYCFLTSSGNIGVVQLTKLAILGHSDQDYVEATILVWAK